MKQMYRVSYGTRSWWTSIPQIQKREVVKVTAKTVVYQEPREVWRDGAYRPDGYRESREHLESDGVKWFDDFEEAREFALKDTREKLRMSEERAEIFKGNIELLENLKEGEEV